MNEYTVTSKVIPWVTNMIKTNIGMANIIDIDVEETQIRIIDTDLNVHIINFFTLPPEVLEE